MTESDHEFVEGFLTRVNGERLRVAVEHEGAPGPAVVYLNGMGLPLDYWDPVIRFLPHVTAFRFDRPGLGGSPRSLRPSDDLTDEIDRALAVADMLAANRPLIFVGHSYGGVIAEAAARLHPDRCVGLVTVDGSDAHDYADDNSQPEGRASRALTSALLAVPQITRFAGTSLEQAMTYATTTRGDGPRLSRAQRALVSSPTHLATAVAENSRFPKHCSQALTVIDEHPMPEIPVRILVASRTGGRLFNLPLTRWVDQNRDRLSELGPDAAIVELPAAHLMMFDVPEKIADTIRDIVEVQSRDLD